MKTKTFLIPRVVQVPTVVWQVALQNWKALHKTLDFSFLAARFFFPLFRGLLTNPFLDGWSVVVRNLGLHSALPCVILGPFNISNVLVVAGHVLGKLSSGNQHFVGSDVATLAGAVSTSSARSWRARGACDLAVLKREHFGCDAVLAGFAGRHGEEQRAPGGRRAIRPLPGALRQARRVDCHIRDSSANMSDLP